MPPRNLERLVAIADRAQRLTPFPANMSALLVGLFAALRSSSRSSLELEAETLALRHPLAVLQRHGSRRLRLGRTERLLWVMLSRAGPSWRRAVQIVTPDTLVPWHRRAFALTWRWRSRRRRPGRPTLNADLRALILRMHAANPLWGALRIHGGFRKLGLDVAPAAVGKCLPRSRGHRGPSSQSWRTFLTNHVAQRASCDFFTVPTATFRVLFVFVILSHARRCILHANVTADPTATWTAQKLCEARPDAIAPRFLLRDRDGIYAPVLRRTVGAFGMEAVVTATHAPWQKPFAERLIGTLRRECLDHVVVWNERGLRLNLRPHVGYYHWFRPHLSIGKDAPVHRAVQLPTTGPIVEVAHLGGVEHHCDRRAA